MLLKKLQEYLEIYIVFYLCFLFTTCNPASKCIQATSTAYQVGPVPVLSTQQTLIKNLLAATIEINLYATTTTSSLLCKMPTNWVESLLSSTFYSFLKNVWIFFLKMAFKRFFGEKMTFQPIKHYSTILLMSSVCLDSRSQERIQIWHQFSDRKYRKCKFFDYLEGGGLDIWIWILFFSLLLSTDNVRL